MTVAVVDRGGNFAARRHHGSARLSQEEGQVKLPLEPGRAVRADGGVLPATFATTGDRLRWTITFAPSARTTGSAQSTPRLAAADTAARARGG